MNNVPVRHSNSEEHRRLIASTVNQLISVVKTIALTDSSTTTDITDERASADKIVMLVPTNAAAAAENTFITMGNQTFTITHSSASTTRNFQYYIAG
jgi:DeoR/GlpR family transcriptional regulator of sugar metabolism